MQVYCTINAQSSCKYRTYMSLHVKIWAALPTGYSDRSQHRASRMSKAGVKSVRRKQSDSSDMDDNVYLEECVLVSTLLGCSEREIEPTARATEPRYPRYCAPGTLSSEPLLIFETKRRRLVPVASSQMYLESFGIGVAVLYLCSWPEEHSQQSLLLKDPLLESDASATHQQIHFTSFHTAPQD
jgi:hypothetical protein